MVESEDRTPGTIRVHEVRAADFVAAAFRSMDVPEKSAFLIAEVLVSADMRGIRSHGLARIPYFLTRLERGLIVPRPSMSFAAGSDTTGLLDADGAIGIVAADRAMNEAMAMAAGHGTGLVVVKDSSHFGYAGFWAERAMQAGYIGISLSNSGGRVAPTFGQESLLGTNPLAVAIPAAAGATGFSLDMATSTVAVGKVETAIREERPLPAGWVAPGREPTLDDDGVLTSESPLLALGGSGTLTGGHKGYGLALMVDLLCGALGGTDVASRVAGAAGDGPPAMGHLMGAIEIDGFRPKEEVQAAMEATFRRIRTSAREPGQDRIYIHGEPEAIAEEAHRREGIPVTPMVREQLERWATRLGIEPLRP